METCGRTAVDWTSRINTRRNPALVVDFAVPRRSVRTFQTDTAPLAESFRHPEIEMKNRLASVRTRIRLPYVATAAVAVAVVAAVAVAGPATSAQARPTS